MASPELGPQARARRGPFRACRARRPVPSFAAAKPATEAAVPVKPRDREARLGDGTLTVTSSSGGSTTGTVQPQGDAGLRWDGVAKVRRGQHSPEARQHAPGQADPISAKAGGSAGLADRRHRDDALRGADLHALTPSGLAVPIAWPRRFPERHSPRFESGARRPGRPSSGHALRTEGITLRVSSG